MFCPGTIEAHRSKTELELALCHSNMDFDCLSAQFALTRLYNGCRMVLSAQLTGNVRSFVALHRDKLPIQDIRYVDMSKIERVFLVDCQSLDRLDELTRNLLEKGIRPHLPGLVVFDHHNHRSSANNDLPAYIASGSQIEAVGACTTLVVERLMKEGVKLSPFEATVIAIGIYEDTGALTFSGATARDAAAVAYLLEQGADVGMIRDCMKVRFESEQQELFEALLKTALRLEVDGHRYVIASLKIPEYLDGLAAMTRQLLELESCEAAFAAVQMRDRVHLVGRSDSLSVNVQEIMREFGGDGHRGAGSAVLKGANPEHIKARLVDILKAHSKPLPNAEALMRSPVRTIKSDTTMDEAGRLMLRYNIDGLVVMEGDALVGIVSRRDIDQSRHHKLSHAKVSGFMSHPVISVDKHATLDEMQKLMVSQDIGRLPVVDEKGRLAGLVNRQDILDALSADSGRTHIYEKFNQSAWGTVHRNRQEVSLAQHLTKLPAILHEAIEAVGRTADQLGLRVYTVGGFVRDLLLHLPNFDLDFVVEGPAISLADRLIEQDKRFSLVASHERFGTATLRFGDEMLVDLSTARTEFYEYPAALPQVEPSNLSQDLLRRDFTINALAVSINEQSFGRLVDLFGGLSDLEAKVIRILHPFSFIEDPTRIVRAARFAGRLGFHLDTKTKEQARRAVGMGIFDDLGGVRIKEELKLILEGPERIKTLALLNELGGLGYLDKLLHFSTSVKASMRRAERLLDRIADLETGEAWVVYLGVLLSELPPDRSEAVLTRLQLTNKQKETVLDGLDLHRHMPVEMRHLKRSELFHLMKERPLGALAIAAAVAQIGTDLRRCLKLYIDELAQVKLEIGGKDLLALGFASGPRLGVALSEILDAKIDRKAVGREAELKLAAEILAGSLR